MSYFPLVDDIAQLKAFDGWLQSALYLALRKRRGLLAGMGMMSVPIPHALSRADLLHASATTSSGSFVDLRIPSLLRVSSVLLRAARAYGPNAIARGTGAMEYQYLLSTTA
jgi:hypothetical protein